LNAPESLASLAAAIQRGCRVLAVGWSAAGASVESGCHLPQCEALGRVGLTAQGRGTARNGYAMNDGNAEQSNETVGVPANPTQVAAQSPSVAPSSEAPSPTEAAAEAGKPSPSKGTVAATAPKSHGWLRRFFWLDGRVAEAAAKGFADTNPGWPAFALARQARAGIVQIGETGEGNGAVLLLEREEVLLLLRSHLERRNLASIGMGLSEDDWARARQVPAVEEVWVELSGAQQAALQAGLGAHADQALLSSDVKQRRYLAAALRKLATALAEPLEREASLVGRVLFMRWARIGAAALVLLAIAWSISASVEKKFGKPNIALGRPVTISSQFGDTALDHTLLVDGDKTNLGFHTDTGPNQWVMIDLGSSKNISKVVVYNRAECCQDRAIPLRLEVSDDGANFRKVADRTEEFDVWTAKGFNEKGRYVRLRHLGSNFLHLAEVEIY
jgi:hypothetical protein